ncbi:DUF7845 domain-containing protein [Halolamina sediminis]|uniref:DUF7845 domain-containing protein n=1 Tax=Halolamina sediminis TaxID=1480675 RepID=UPI0006B64061|nr:hypothetical protein [Halolamina sediminis]
MKSTEPAWHEFALQLNYAGSLEAHFGAARIVDQSGGSRVTEFTASGERWTAKLYYQESGICDPGDVLPTGTAWEFDGVREHRIAIQRHGEEDPVGEQKLNAHIRPRWDGMRVEQSDGSRRKLDVPFREGVNVVLSGSNVDAQRYQPLLRGAATALGLNPGHFRDPHDSSTVRDGERYVRVHCDASGPIHARDGPIAQMGHLLENDRSGYRKVVQNDDNDHGENLPGYYHTVTLGPSRVREAFPEHTVPVEIKHYYAREALSRSKDDPLRHPKLGVSYQVSRWDGSVGVTPDELADLERELDRTLRAVLEDAGVTMTPGAGGGPFVEDAYFDADLTELEESEQPPKLNLTRIRNEQESIVIRQLMANGGLSEVEEEALGTLVTDGGKVSPADIAEEHSRHVGSVRRALRRIDDMVEREYGSVSLRSPHVAEMVHDAVQQFREASRSVTEAAGQALLSAERGLSDATSALMTWCAKHGVDVDNRGEAIEAIRLGEIDSDRRRPGDPLRGVRWELREGLKRWLESGRDREAFANATVRWREEDRGRRSLPASAILR